jgi:hypothetical protein
MATWDWNTLANENCPKCGTEYKVSYQELPLKDKDSYTCECGHVMREWKSTRMYSYEPIGKE